MWREGTINGYKYWAKVYDEGSIYGINEGRISKLTIRKVGETRDLYNYDRGLDVDCANDEVKAVLETILEMYK
jgi:hypothetical protein